MIRRPIVYSLGLLVCLLLAVAPRGAAVSLPAQSGGVQITGTVVDGSLAPLAGVVITLNRQGATIARTMSDVAGRFRFERVVPGDYEVKATHASAPTLVRTVRIGANSTTVQLPLVMALPVKASDATAEHVATANRTAAMPAPAAAPPVSVSGGASVSQGLAGGRGAGA